MHTRKLYKIAKGELLIILSTAFWEKSDSITPIIIFFVVLYSIPQILKRSCHLYSLIWRGHASILSISWTVEKPNIPEDEHSVGTFSNLTITTRLTSNEHRKNILSYRIVIFLVAQRISTFPLFSSNFFVLIFPLPTVPCRRIWSLLMFVGQRCRPISSILVSVVFSPIFSFSCHMIAVWIRWSLPSQLLSRRVHVVEINVSDDFLVK